MEREDFNLNEMTPKKESFSNKKLAIKMIVMAVIILLMFIPKALIESSISEREQTAREAMSDIFSKMGGRQLVTGPYLNFGCVKREKVKTDGKYEDVEYANTMTLLPDFLNVSGDMKSSLRHRSIYEVMTYEVPLEMNGSFVLSEDDVAQLSKQGTTELVKVCFDISDLKGVSGEVRLKLGDKEYCLVPDGYGLCSGVKRLSAQVDQAIFEQGKEVKFSMKLSLKGSESLQFVPVGKNTVVRLKSDCDTPSFCGDILPANPTVTDSGFDRTWQTSYMNRSYPQLFEEDAFKSEISDSSFGVNLLVPVGHYQKTMRCVKYCMLFIVLTFAVFFFIEMIQRKNVHPIQYLLVGLALTLFYSLLLSFSEHIGFTPAYVVAGGMTIAMLTLYTSAVLKIKKTAFCIGGMLAVLYLYIFVLIQMETYAMLAGSLGLFVILGIIMYFSQKINWSKSE